jgi:predicted nucleotidyltransferase component of viral defense system
MSSPSKDSVYFRKARLVLKTLPFLDNEKNFALHGGTAINFFVRDMPRFSVDIDLTFLPVTDRETADGEISAMLLRLRERLRKTRMTATIMGDERAPRGIVVEEDGITIKVEGNFVFTGSLFPTEPRKLCSAAQSALEMYVEANVLSMRELYGSKICAAIDRQHPRDLFDVKLLLEGEGLTDEIRKSFIVYLVSHERLMSEILDPNFVDLEKSFKSEFNGMTLMSVYLEELQTARQNMLRTLRKGMTEKERSFLLSIKKKQPDWNLIEPDGVCNLPAVKARLKRIEGMGEKEHEQATEKLVDCLKLWGPQGTQLFHNSPSSSGI